MLYGLVLNSWNLVPAQLQEAAKTRVSYRLWMASIFHLGNRTGRSDGNDPLKLAG